MVGNIGNHSTHMTNPTKEEVQQMIDAAITQHNRNASMISMVLGIIFLALFVDGFFRTIGMIPPFLGIDVSIIKSMLLISYLSE